MAVSGQIDFKISGQVIGSNAFGGGPFWQGDFSLSQVFGDGVTANNFDRLYMAERTVLTGANDDIDLNGVLQDALGVTISAVELVGFAIMNRRKDASLAANTTNLTIGGSSSGVPGFTTAGLVIRPGGLITAFNPDASGLATITAGTGDIFRVTNSAGATNIYCAAFFLRTS